MTTFYNYGLPETRQIVTLHRSEDGVFDWSSMVPRGQFFIGDETAPWNQPDQSSDPADYPGLLWTPPLIVELTKIPQPDPIPGKIAEPIIVWTETSCTRDWEIRDMTPSELADTIREVWPNTQAFLAEFSLAEMAGIGLSTDPTIAALRLMLSVWAGQIYSDDPRVVTGIDAIEAAGILTAERAAQILTKS